MDDVNMNQPTSGKSPRGYHHGDLRRELLAAALKLLDVGGIDAVTVRAVAREANVAHSAPANHFKDRTALLTQLAIDTFKALIDDVDAACATRGGGKRSQIEAFADEFLRFALQHPQRYRLLWRADTIDQTLLEFQAAGGAVYERLRQIMVPENSLPRQVSADTQVVAAWSLVHGYISLRLDGTLIAGIDENTGQPRERAIISALLDGIA
jgi:AcrR family transcriptional regulator